MSRLGYFLTCNQAGRKPGQLPGRLCSLLCKLKSVVILSRFFSNDVLVRIQVRGATRAAPGLVAGKSRLRCSRLKVWSGDLDRILHSEPWVAGSSPATTFRRRVAQLVRATVSKPGRLSSLQLVLRTPLAFTASRERRRRKLPPSSLPTVLAEIRGVLSYFASIDVHSTDSRLAYPSCEDKACGVGNAIPASNSARKSRPRLALGCRVDFNGCVAQLDCLVGALNRWPSRSEARQMRSRSRHHSRMAIRTGGRS